MTVAPAIDSKRREAFELLRRVPLFRGLEDAELERLTAVVKLRRWQKGSTILTEGDPGDSLFVLQRGTVKVTRANPDGQEVVLAFLQAGDFFGELSLLDGRRRSANVIALEDIEAQIIERNDFLGLLRSYPILTLRLLEELTQRLRASDEQIALLALSSAEGRVLRVLIKIADGMGARRNDPDVVIVAPPIQQDLADMAGTSRETVSRALKSLEKRGLISRVSTGIKLPNSHDLRTSFL